MTIHTTTHYGLRAPNDNEYVRNGADAMRDLADDIDTVLHDALAGLPSDTNRTVAGSTVVSPDAYGAAAITFPVGSFGSAPVVVVSNGDTAAWLGHVELVSRTSTGFTVVCFSSTPIVQTFISGYAEWAVNHGETVNGTNTRMRAGATGPPTPRQAPPGNVRINWIAVGAVA